VEIIELAHHPWFVGTQFHAEYRSRPNRPHPLYRSFVAAVLRRAMHAATPRPKEATQPAANR
jgi:CTP synthase